MTSTDIAIQTALKRIRPLSLEAAHKITTDELRRAFLVEDLFEPGEMKLVYTDLDRMVIGGVMPVGETGLPALSALGTRYFTERREVGIMNIGQPGIVKISGVPYSLKRLDCLYVGIEEEEVSLCASPHGQPAFYICSTPAHRKYPTTLIAYDEAEVEAVGDERHASRRTIRKYIYPSRMASCQLMMGITEIDANSVWNSIPPHTHSRRSEIYFYFDLNEEILVHLMGTPNSTRHLIVRDRQAVLSPSWSIHAGVGTANYRFLWAMAGENQDFADIDPLGLAGLY